MNLQPIYPPAITFSTAGDDTLRHYSPPLKKTSSAAALLLCGSPVRQ
ncbi:MAG: hypothetical protein JNJ94_04350 [Chlorobi bacterium]|nr:hypothetical protein [Chlorobiota bacterium]